MASKSLQVSLFVCAVLIALLFLKLMFDMNSSMREMTGHVGASMLRMEQSIHGLGQAFSQGSKQFQQMNPAGMMQQVLPGSDQRTR
jgi:hypothetical protein